MRLVQDSAPSLLPDDGSHRAAYETITDDATLDRWLHKISHAVRVALDTETTSLDEQQARLVGISFAVAPGEAAYLPLAHNGPDTPAQLPYEATLEKLKPWLEDTTPRKVMQHAKYDQHVFANHGIRLAGIVDDTLLAAYVLEAGQVSPGALELGTLARRHLGLSTIPYEKYAPIKAISTNAKTAATKIKYNFRPMLGLNSKYTSGANEMNKSSQ